jgi:hypothetical protein
MRRAEHVVCVEEIRNTYKILLGKPEGKRPFERYPSIWENNIKTEKIGLVWNRFVRFRIGTLGKLLWTQ